MISLCARDADASMVLNFPADHQHWELPDQVLFATQVVLKIMRLVAATCSAETTTGLCIKQVFQWASSTHVRMYNVTATFMV